MEFASVVDHLESTVIPNVILRAVKFIFGSSCAKLACSQHRHYAAFDPEVTPERDACRGCMSGMQSSKRCVSLDSSSARNANVQHTHALLHHTRDTALCETLLAAS